MHIPERVPPHYRGATPRELSVRKGEIVIDLQENNRGSLKVKSCRLVGQEGLVDLINLRKSTPLEQQP